MFEALVLNAVENRKMAVPVNGDEDEDEDD